MYYEDGDEINCPICGKTLVFGDEYDGEFYCSRCKSLINVDDDDSDIPPGCAACGGDYPNCKWSCNAFDD